MRDSELWVWHIQTWTHSRRGCLWLPMATCAACHSQTCLTGVCSQLPLSPWAIGPPPGKQWLPNNFLVSQLGKVGTSLAEYCALSFKTDKASKPWAFWEKGKGVWPEKAGGLKALLVKISWNVLTSQMKEWICSWLTMDCRHLLNMDESCLPCCVWWSLPCLWPHLQDL